MKSMGVIKIAHAVSPGLRPGIFSAAPGQSPGLTGNHNPGTHTIFLELV